MQSLQFLHISKYRDHVRDIQTVSHCVTSTGEIRKEKPGMERERKRGGDSHYDKTLPERNDYLYISDGFSPELPRSIVKNIDVGW